jgi:hypothetical protein
MHVIGGCQARLHRKNYLLIKSVLTIARDTRLVRQATGDGYLDELSEEARREPAWSRMPHSIQALFDGLRFVNPLQLCGKKSLKEITGGEIADYVAEFFEKNSRRPGLLSR